MTDKITLTNLVNLQNETTAVNAINSNNSILTTAMDNTLSRDGTTPNTMLNNFDMNSHQILNLPAPATALSPLRLTDLQSFTGGGTITGIPGGGAIGSALVKTSGVDYQVGWGNTVPREALTGARTYYVRTDGSDTHTGLTNTSGGAFLTIQKAINVIQNTLDLQQNIVTIQVGAGTYTGLVEAYGPCVGSAPIANFASIVILGDTTTPSNVLINTNSASASAITADNGARIRVRGVKLQAAGGGAAYALRANNGSFIYYDLVEFGICTTGHKFALNGGQIVALGNYAISGGATSHEHAQGGYIENVNNTVTITNTPTFTSYFVGLQFGFIFHQANVWSGSVGAGPAYLLHNGGVFNNNGEAMPTGLVFTSAVLTAGSTGIVNGTGITGLNNLSFDTDTTKQLAFNTTAFTTGTTRTWTWPNKSATVAGTDDVTLSYRLTGANMNITTDQAIPITLPAGYTRYRIQGIFASNPSISLTTANGGFYGGLLKTNTVVTAVSFSVLSSTAANTSGNFTAFSVLNANTTAYNYSTIYLSLTTPQGSASTADITVIVNPLP